MKITLFSAPGKILSVVDAKMVGKTRITPTEGEFAGIRFRVELDDSGHPWKGKAEAPMSGAPHWRIYKEGDAVDFELQQRREAARTRIDAAIANIEWRTTPPDILEALASAVESAGFSQRTYDRMRLYVARTLSTLATSLSASLSSSHSSSIPK